MSETKDSIILRFKCISCGKCCSDPQTFVNLTFKDILNLKKGLKISANELLQYIGFYTYKVEEERDLMEKMVYSPVITEKGKAYVGILRQEGSKCIFLNDENRCTIYHFRPKICRSFPFSYKLIDGNKGSVAKLDVIYTKKGLEYCPGITSKSPIIKRKKILNLITANLAEISADHNLIQSWNKLAENKKFSPKASNYIHSIIEMDNQLKIQDKKVGGAKKTKKRKKDSYYNRKKRRKFS
jgi:Fe-S-cluster containining protein